MLVRVHDCMYVCTHGYIHNGMPSLLRVHKYCEGIVSRSYTEFSPGALKACWSNMPSFNNFVLLVGKTCMHTKFLLSTNHVSTQS